MNEFIEIGNQVKIPKQLYDLLSDPTLKKKVRIFKDESKFKLFSLKKLTHIIRIDGREYTVAEQLKGYADTLKEFYGTHTFDQDENEYPLNQLAKGIAIGFENIRILFIDCQANNQLCIFHPDGGDITKLAIRVSELKLKKKA